MAYDDSDDFADEDFSDPTEDAALHAAAARLTASGGAAEPPSIKDPQDGPVTLPAGFRRPRGEGDFEVVRKAWVRELNGEDEERIAKAQQRGDFGDFINAILVSGVDKLGDLPPTSEDFANMVLGDRGYLLLEISRATYGDDLEYEDFVCPHCKETISFVVHKSTDIPVTRLNSVDEADFEVRLHNDRVAQVTLPTAEISTEMSKTKTEAEATTILIANCVSEIRGGSKGSVQVEGDPDVARKLGLRDRLALTEAIDKHMPGPKYDGVRFTHPECGKEIRLAVNLADLFRGL